MISAVDTNVLLDIFGADSDFGARSSRAFRSCQAGGRIIACEVVWTETASFFPSPEAAAEAMSRLGVDFEPSSSETALVASGAWKEYRQRGGRRHRVVADFLVGAHAASCAERLLTRDRGFYRTYFEGLTILDPSADSPA